MKKLLFILFLFSGNAFAQKDCDSSRIPIVFVHGFMASGDTWATQVQRYSTNGFCENRLFVFDWNTFGGDRKQDSLLDVFINDILQRSHARQVNLVGHSAGTGLCFGYLKDSLHALKVAHYVNIAGFKMKSAAGPGGIIPTLNIYSTGDNVVPGSDIPGAENIKLTGKDHLQAATSEETFSAMFNFFNADKRLPITEIGRSENASIMVGGKGVLLGDNKPVQDSFIVYLFNPKTGKRYSDNQIRPGGVLGNWSVFNKDGRWGFEVKKDSYLEFEVHPEKGRRLFYFFEPSLRNNQNMYIRTLPQSGMLSAMLGDIPADDQQTALVIFSSNQAVIAGRDSLAIDSIPLSTAILAPASKTAIAFFIFDEGDKTSPGSALKRFKMAPFLSGADVFIKADEKNNMRVYYNGRSMVLPKMKSKEGIMIAVFN